MTHVLTIRTDKTNQYGQRHITYRCDTKNCDTRGDIKGRGDWILNLFDDLKQAHAFANDGSRNDIT